jgi:hypothetical protein
VLLADLAARAYPARGAEFRRCLWQWRKAVTMTAMKSDQGCPRRGAEPHAIARVEHSSGRPALRLGHLRLRRRADADPASKPAPHESAPSADHRSQLAASGNLGRPVRGGLESGQPVLLKPSPSPHRGTEAHAGAARWPRRRSPRCTHERSSARTTWLRLDRALSTSGHRLSRPACISAEQDFGVDARCRVGSLHATAHIGGLSPHPRIQVGAVEKELAA